MKNFEEYAEELKNSGIDINLDESRDRLKYLFKKEYNRGLEFLNEDKLVLENMIKNIIRNNDNNLSMFMFFPLIQGNIVLKSISDNYEKIFNEVMVIDENIKFED